MDDGRPGIFFRAFRVAGAVLVSGAVFLCLTDTVQALAVPPDLPKLLSRGHHEKKQGRWFWAVEAWQEAVKISTEPTTADEGFSETLHRAETFMAEGTGPAERRLYYSCLRDYLILDYAQLWNGFRRMEKNPRFAEESRWFLWGPTASDFKKRAGDVSWTKAGRLFLAGWRRYERGEWRAASVLFQKAIRQQPRHFLAEKYLEFTRRNLAESGAFLESDETPQPRKMSLPPAIFDFSGSDEERIRRGEESFRAGRWSAALAWFNSVLAGVGEKHQVVLSGAWHASRRLAWMVNRDSDK